METDPGSVLRPVVARLADVLSDQPLAEAEAVIDATRCYLWMKHFTGFGGETAMAVLNAPSFTYYAGVEIATACASAPEPLLAAERVLLELRMQLYMAAYGAAPGCRAVG